MIAKVLYLELCLAGILSLSMLCQGESLAAVSDIANSGKALVAPADTTANQANEPVTDKWALVIGISKFADHSLNLKYAAKDASDFKDFLLKDGNFAPDHVRLLLDGEATKETILAEFGDKWLPRVARPTDLVVLYFSTHGSPSTLDIRGVNYIVAHDTDKNSLFSTGIAMREIAEAIKERIHCRRVLIILDACHSGAATDFKGLVRQSNFDAESVAQGTGQLVICSSLPEEVTWESKNYQNGVFTRNLIEALRENDGQISVGDAFKLTQKRVQEEVQRDRGVLQTPAVKSKWTGLELVLAVRPSDPKPGLADVYARPITASGATGTEPRAETPIGIAGRWDSNWGPVTFEHDPINGDKPVALTGHWEQGPKKLGVFKSGTFDPATRTVKVSYYQNWNFLHGSAKFKLNKSGRRMDGRFKQALILGGTWILWR
jgi:uncharacterized caspase-like protein